MTDYKKLIATPFYYDDNYSSWVLGRFVAAYDVVHTNIEGFKGKYTYDDIKPNMSIDDIKGLLDKKKLAIDVNASDKNNGENNGENGTITPTKTIAYNDKSDKWVIKDCTAVQLLNWINENVSTAENMDKMIIEGTLKIKIPKK